MEIEKNANSLFKRCFCGHRRRGILNSLCPPPFLASNDATVNSYNAIHDAKEKTSKPFLDSIRRPKMIDLTFFATKQASQRL